MLWLCLHLPDLGLEIASRGNSEPRPMVLVEDNRVVLRNAEATTHGIVLGTTLATAHSICHDLKHFIRDAETERHRLRFLAEATYHFSNSVSIHESNAIVLEVGGSLKLFGGIYALKRRLIALFKRLGHAVGIGTAHTPAAALAFARAHYAGELTSYPSIDEVKAHTRAGLRQLPLRFTECDAATTERFVNMGITSLGQVLRLPTADLGRRFGPEFLNYLRRLEGRRADPLLNVTPAERFEASVNLLESVSNKNALSFPMQRLTHELSAWLIAHQLGCTSIRWRFTTLGDKRARSERMQMRVDFAEPQQSNDTVLAISRLQLDSSELPEEIMSVSLESRALSAWQTESRTLFNHSQKTAQPPSKLIDQYRARLGGDACHCLHSVSDHRPERAWAQRQPGQTRAQGSASQVNDKGRRRPLWLLQRPEPVVRAELTLLTGPERIDNGWWERGARARRDYYIALHSNGAKYWVFEEVIGRHRSWHVHGYFA